MLESSVSLNGRTLKAATRSTYPVKRRGLMLLALRAGSESPGQKCDHNAIGTRGRERVLIGGERFSHHQRFEEPLEDGDRDVVVV